MIPVHVRVPEDMVRGIDKWIREGRFSSRSEAVKAMISFYEEREKTREFFSMLVRRSREARENPDILIPIGKVK